MFLHSAAVRRRHNARCRAPALITAALIACVSVRGGVRRPSSKAGGQKSVAYQVAYPIPFWGVKWHHQTAQSAGGQVTIAAWNNEK